MEYGKYYQQLKKIKTRLDTISKSLDFENKKFRLEELLCELADPNIWSNRKKAQTINQEKAELENIVNVINNVNNALNDNHELLDIAVNEKDEEAIKFLIKDIIANEAMVANLEFEYMFKQKVDKNNAFIEIQAGSGGTEAQDWAEMLLRMYLRFCEQQNFNTKLLEVQAGEVAGIKSATIFVKANYAFGWLRTEIGIHRLVRKSPFNANSKRHTSFAAVFVSPEIDDNVVVNINTKDLRIDTYRASGAGGQHVNKTDSAVRITHLPTSIVVQCQDGRSQHANKEQAMKQLRSKLYELERQKQQVVKQELEDNKSDIGWGQQIRSYVLDDGRIKDLRTGFESHNVAAVLNGDILDFIKQSLKQKSLT